MGSRLDVRQTGSETEAFKGDRCIFHIDCQAGEINNRVKGCHPILADLQTALPVLEQAFADAGPARDGYSDWIACIAELRTRWPDTAELNGVPGINPNVFCHQLAASARNAAAYVVDVGQHQMWAAQSLDLCAEQRFLTSGSMGSMGFALPASLGAAFSTRQPVVVVAGDGGLQCNIQELQTIAHHNLPVKIVVLNNGCHGMVRQFQESYFDSRYQSTFWGYSAPDFAKVANAYGIRGASITAPSETERALSWLCDDAEGPKLLQVMIDLHANAYPKIAFGKPISEMEPLAKPTAMEST
jgi:acetolactate synthase-1/2/3 large subunit